MKVYKFNKRDIRFAPWAALCVLGLIAAMVFALPSQVFAETLEFSQDCETAKVGEIHTIRVKVTDYAGSPFGIWFGRYNPGGPNSGTFVSPYPGPGVSALVPDANGEFEYTFESTGVGVDELVFINQMYIDVGIVNTTWTDDDQDPALLACAGPSPESPVDPKLVIGGWDKLKDKKWGGVTIAICGAGCTDSFNVYDVDRDSVRMEGISPYRAVYRDSRLCPGGKDAYVDLVLRFKRRHVLKALEESLGGELVDGEPVTLHVTATLKEEVPQAVDGTLKDETVLEGTWDTVIKKIKKRRRWRRY